MNQSGSPRLLPDRISESTMLNYELHDPSGSAAMIDLLTRYPHIFRTLEIVAYHQSNHNSLEKVRLLSLLARTVLAIEASLADGGGEFEKPATSLLDDQ